jgi:hypothetical protein
VSGPEPVPPGAQPERTALAWRRTALSVAVASLVGARVLEPWAGPAVWLLAVVGVVAAAGLARAGARRSAVWARVQADDAAAGPGGGVLAATAGAVVALGVVAVLAALALPTA